VASAPARVLLVEDDEGIRTVIRELLVEEGFELFQAPDVHSALDLVAQHQFDLVLVDLVLVRGNGVSFLRQYREMTDVPAPVIVTTAAEEVPEGMEGVAAVLLKPFDLDALLSLVNTYTGRR
jgi:two-component system, response regulator, stage 0 sporulation protein F